MGTSSLNRRTQFFFDQISLASRCQSSKIEQNFHQQLFQGKWKITQLRAIKSPMTWCFLFPIEFWLLCLGRLQGLTKRDQEARQSTSVMLVDLGQ
jgi:hypothetical protein